jgi:hypothetical protein
MPFLKVYSPNFCPTFTEWPQGRANQYLVGGGGGGKFKNLGALPFRALPLNKHFPESKNFSGKFWREEGGGTRFVSENKTSQKIFKH